MMDATALFPQGFHPVNRYNDRGGRTRVERLPRQTGLVKYYYIDFGMSTQVTPGTSQLVLGHDGLDQDVPELSEEVPYDPFKVDIFIVGNLFKTSVYDVCNVFCYQLRRQLNTLIEFF
jgi:hypothetical protein